jgi:D-3-phosphoglycerate dehydrogenase
MINKQETFYFDFDSTFIQVEALDVLCEIIYAAQGSMF